MTDLLTIHHLSIAYPSRNTAPPQAVRDVSFTLHPGDRLGLVGESGCGKTTLGKAILGLLPAGSQVQGEIAFNGETIAGFDAERWRRFRGEVVGLVFQDPMTRLDPLMTIGDHCLETLRAHRPELSKAEAKTRALAVLAAVRIPADRWGQYPHEFSGGMRQRVAIALALLLDPKVMIADEPTTSLDVTVAAEILQEITRLCAERDLALILISHDLALVGAYCDRLGVMYQGELVEMGSAQGIFRQPQHPYSQSLLAAALHMHHGEQRTPPQLTAEPLLRVEALEKTFVLEKSWWDRFRGGNGEAKAIRAVDRVSFDLYPGEIFGLVGESGCGKSTLSRTILQLMPATSGRVLFQGQDLTQLDRRHLRRQRRQLQMIFQDPHACLNPRMTIATSIGDPLLIHHLATPQDVPDRVDEMLNRVGLDPKIYRDRYPKDLSGGQQQRVAIARALITRPQLVICDEPVSMLDASVQTQVLDLMLALKAEFNLTYLFITHDLWVARFLCDRIAVMNQGQIIELGETETIFTQPQQDYTRRLLAAAPLLNQVA